MTNQDLMTNEEIKQKLPHRWPFLLIDRVTKLNEKVVEGYKNVSASDIVFLGHFPEISIFPGVLIVEALAQLSGLLLSNQYVYIEDELTQAGEGRIGFLTSIRSFKFIKTVTPGDRLFLKSIYKAHNADCYIFSVSAYVDKLEIAVGEIQLFLQRRDAVI
jgi:3-hydroxyacyl-[acyl-carrier-protein] dehydratase